MVAAALRTVNLISQLLNGGALAGRFDGRHELDHFSRLSTICGCYCYIHRRRKTKEHSGVPSSAIPPCKCSL